MKKNAFTLLELLGVVIILGVLSLITFPIILNQIKNAKQGIKDSTKTLIIDAAKDYYEDNTNNYEKIEGMTYCIDIKTLTDENYLNKNLKNENLNNIDTNKKVKLIFHNNKFDYDVTDTCQNNSLTRNNIEVPIVTENSGLYKSQTDTDRFIYRGGDPINNWIELNEGTEQTPDYVKYRIISFENDGTIKVVRDERIDTSGIKWDEGTARQNDQNTYCTTTNGCNIWANQSNTYYNGQTLNKLNQDFYFYYYDDSQATNLSNMSQLNFGTVTTDSQINTYLNNTWINKLNFKDAIETHSFDIGGLYYASTYTGGDKGIIKEKQEEQIFKWNGKIGLLNITEYTESSTNEKCKSVYSNYYHALNLEGNLLRENLTTEGWPCKNNNFNYKNYNQWSISANSINRRSVWYIYSSGYFNTYNAESSISIRPAFYIKPSISLTGEGSETNPYRIVGES